MRLGIIAAGALSLALAACETPTYYQAATRPGAVGYTDYQIEPGRYRINFQGGDGAPAGQIRDFVMLRAAQVTLRDGYDWFRIVDREGAIAPPRNRGSVSIGIGGFNFGRGGGFGGGASVSQPIGGGPQIGRSIEILTGHGQPPDAGAYDARAVDRSLGPRAAPPARS